MKCLWEKFSSIDLSKLANNMKKGSWIWEHFCLKVFICLYFALDFVGFFWFLLIPETLKQWVRKIKMCVFEQQTDIYTQFYIGWMKGCPKSNQNIQGILVLNYIHNKSQLYTHTNFNIFNIAINYQMSNIYYTENSIPIMFVHLNFSYHHIQNAKLVDLMYIQ